MIYDRKVGSAFYRLAFPSRVQDVCDLLGGRKCTGRASVSDERERLPQLLNNSQVRRMLGDVAVQNTPAIVVDDEEAVEHGKGNRGNGEEIHRGNGLPVITKKGEPALSRVRVSGGSFHPAGNRPFGNSKAKHEKFSVDAGSSPTGVLGHHLEDEIPNFF